MMFVDASKDDDDDNDVDTICVDALEAPTCAI